MMKFRIGILAAMLAGGVPAVFATTSSCGTASVSGAFTCNLYESDHGEYSNAVTTPTDINPGYVILLESGLALTSTNESNLANWSDIVVFTDNFTTPPTAQLVSSGASFYSTLESTVISSGNYAFISEASSGPTTYIGGTNLNHTYNLYSTEETPEPSTLGFVGLGLAGIVVAVRRRALAQQA